MIQQSINFLVQANVRGPSAQAGGFVLFTPNPVFKGNFAPYLKN
jgi:hypothetical protein